MLDTLCIPVLYVLHIYRSVNVYINKICQQVD